MFYYNLQVASKKGLYTYKSKEKIQIGTTCLVNFYNKEQLGLIISEINENDIDFDKNKIKEIQNVFYDDILSENVIKLIEWMKKYYISDYNLIIPAIKKLSYKDYLKIEKYKNEVEKIKLDELKNNNTILNEEQQKVYEEIISSDNKFFLLYGVTGSGKTEVYIKIIEENLKNDKETILLVPEIALTTQIMKRLKKEFGNNVVIYNSKITPKQKTMAYLKVKQGKAKVIVGTRSALFLPTNKLATIIIDEEHENTYKQDDNINYNAKTVAFKKASLENAKVILSSATPSFESLHLVETGILKQLNITKRYNNASLPNYEIKEIKNFSEIINDEILDKIADKLKKNEQVIILYNRKSYSILLKCPNCEEIKMCPNCSSKLNYLKSKNILRCNHCNYIEEYSEICNNCNSKMIKQGIGTEKIEEKLMEKFGNEILRMDSDTMSTNNKLEEAYRIFLNKEKKILLGTQMIAKGFHFPDVTLVIVLNLDQILSIPDFRNGEKTFQLVMQASGRAGRGNKSGTVLIQTFDKDIEMIKFIEKNDYIGFFKRQEIYRKAFFLPPFSKLIKISIINKVEKIALQESNLINTLIKEYITKSKYNYSDSINIKEPEPAPIYRINKLFKFNILIYLNNKDYNNIKQILKYIKENIELKSTIHFDVEPLNLM